MTQSSKILEDYKTHFAFGENWSSFSETITPTHIKEAQTSLARLCENLTDKTFLDIGCGSGLHALCALQMGARHVTAIDIDDDSIATTLSTLKRFWPEANYDCFTANILSDFKSQGHTYDNVYSWGVLHHTGDMWNAIDNASKLVAPNGKFIIAIYIKTPLCAFWEKEKKLYTNSPKPVQSAITYLYAFLLALGYAVKGINPIKKIKDYNKNRGMSWWHDCIDWLGGWPYESATPEQVKEFMEQRGFQQTAAYNTKKRVGILGTGCAEYVFTKEDQKE